MTAVRTSATRPSRRRRATTAATAATAAALALGVVAAPAAAAPARPTSYTNPVLDVADTYADPAVIRGKDGWWYAYGTTDPLREGEGQRHLLPISRSRDLVDWTYVGDAFTEDSLPDWADTSRSAALWAPDIRYVDGEYRLYYVVTETTVTDEPNDNAIGVATAPTPAGPWTDSGAPVVGPRRGGAGEPGNFLWTFDPHHVVGTDGEEHLFYGSYYGGIFVSELNEDGTRVVGEPTMVAIDNKFEGAYVVRRDGWWYMFASTANCCAGPTTGYSVHVGRSRDLEGPYVDRQGVPLLQSRAGGTPTLYQNGNRWIGTGHNAVVTDLAGQDWIVYHAIDRADPYLDEPFGINERPMLMDRLDWVDGWPHVRADLGPSEDRQPGPATVGRTVTRFEDGVDAAWWSRGWATRRAPHVGGHLVSTGPAAIWTRAATPGDVRVEADLRQRPGAPRAGLAAGLRRDGAGVAAYVDPRARTLTVQTLKARRTVALPEDYDPTDWHSIVLEVRDGTAVAEVSHARLGDPLAVARLAVGRTGQRPGRAGAVADGAGARLDNLSVLPAADLLEDVVPAPVPGTLAPAPSDDFDGYRLERGWERVRDPQATVTGGVLRWPTEAADLVGTGNDASLLLRDPPHGDWTAETKVTIDLGTDTIRNFQQAGLIAYVHDDLFTRLSHVAIWNTRQIEFGKEMPFAGALAYGGSIIGPPAETTWLRLVHRTDPANGEHELQALSSRDGEDWVEGATWTLPADADLRVGLISHGGAGPTAEFDYLRFYSD